MINNHPIIPSIELLDQWCMDPELDGWRLIAAKAAQWGANQELEACCEVLDMVNGSEYWSQVLRSDRRPKPPSLKEQALEALEHILHNSSTELGAETIRRALGALDD